MKHTLVTATEIAEACGAKRERVVWILQQNQIAIAARAGLVRLYAKDTIQRVRAEMSVQDKRNAKFAAAQA